VPVLAGRPADDPVLAGPVLAGALELEPELPQPAAASATAAAAASPNLALRFLLFLRTRPGIRSIAFSEGIEIAAETTPSRNREPALVNYLIHNSGHNRVIVRRSHIRAGQVGVGRQCRESRGDGSWADG
jgi:hypothetical protein